ncbi:MAG: histidine kinase [Pseudomonas sp.]|jgi:uncharacterized membrane protein affecting hemolysin expression|nr:histidine kinase [Pseudomonas sp.]NLO53760.1 histidine kinase [Gammaproteobacteria bacterium]
MPLDFAHSRRTSIASRITSYVFLTISICLLAFAWMVHTQLQWSLQQQAQALGHSLLQQTRSPVEDALSVDDTLSIAVLLRELVSNPYVSYAALYNVDKRILAEAGLRPSTKPTAAGVYSQQLSLQNITSGSLQLQIDMDKLQQPLTTSLQSMGILALVILLLALLLALHVARSIALPLQNLSNWLINPAPPAPHIQRSDEIGLLARQLNKYFIDDTQADAIPTLHHSEIVASAAVPSSTVATPSAEPIQAYDPLLDTLPVHVLDADTSAAYTQPALNPRTVILAVGFGNMEPLRQLPSERLTDLLKKYRHAVKQAAALYNGGLHTLVDGRSLITFDSDHAEYHRNALCCGELLRAFGHSLQLEVADSGIALHIQLGLSEGPSVKDLSLGELLLSETAQNALNLSQNSRNLLLMNNRLAQHSSIASCSRIRPVTQPAEASCLESLLQPYPGLLQKQLQSLLLA